MLGVKNVKFMWGIFACNELLFKRLGMGELVKCDLCNGIESPWHVIGVSVSGREGGRYSNSLGMPHVETRAEGYSGLESATGIGHGERAEANVEGGRWTRKEALLKRVNTTGITNGNMHGEIVILIAIYLKGLIDKLTQTGSWAVWMGVWVCSREDGWDIC
jgi:hypothetical protein